MRKCGKYDGLMMDWRTSRGGGMSIDDVVDFGPLEQPKQTCLPACEGQWGGP